MVPLSWSFLSVMAFFFLLFAARTLEGSRAWVDGLCFLAGLLPGPRERLHGRIAVDPEFFSLLLCALDGRSFSGCWGSAPSRGRRARGARYLSVRSAEVVG